MLIWSSSSLSYFKFFLKDQCIMFSWRAHHLSIKFILRAGRVIQMAEHLSSKHKALSSTPPVPPKRKKKWGSQWSLVLPLCDISARNLNFQGVNFWFELRSPFLQDEYSKKSSWNLVPSKVLNFRIMMSCMLEISTHQSLLFNLHSKSTNRTIIPPLLDEKIEVQFRESSVTCSGKTELGWQVGEVDS
jgi:hypothetical protein